MTEEEVSRAIRHQVSVLLSQPGNRVQARIEEAVQVRAQALAGPLIMQIVEQLLAQQVVQVLVEDALRALGGAANLKRRIEHMVRREAVQIATRRLKDEVAAVVQSDAFQGAIVRATVRGLEAKLWAEEGA